MIFLRTVLFLGLVLHKLVWEVMKRREISPAPKQKESGFGAKTIVIAVKTLFLVFLIIQTLFLEVLPIMEDPATLSVIGLSIYTIGLVIALTGRTQLGNSWSNIEDYQVKPEQELVQSGIYAYIRHPIYIGDLLLVLGLQLALNSWLFLVVIPMAIVVVRQTLAEEKILSQAFPGYENYRQHTKMYIPFVV